ncbi:MAG: hypothetical protein AABZ57_08325 [Candidatus Margulisiibacteriota bacterium]
MHDTHIMKNIFGFLEEEEKTSSRNIDKIYVNISEFAGMTEQHFLEHYREAASGTKWSNIGIKISKLPYGPEVEITKIEYGEDSK